MDLLNNLLLIVLYFESWNVKITNFVLNIFFNIITEPTVIFFVKFFGYINISNFFIVEGIEQVFAFLFFGFLNMLPGSKISWDHAIVSIFSDTAYQSTAHDAFINFCNKSSLTSRKFLHKPINTDVFYEAFWFLNPKYLHVNFQIPTEIKNFLNVFNEVISIITLICLIIYVTFFIVFFFAYIIGYSLFSKDYAVEQYFNSAQFLNESEKELGSLDDMLIGVVLIITYTMFFFLTWLAFVSSISNWFLAFFVCIFILIFFALAIPNQFLYDLGMFFVFFLKGAGNTTLMFLEYCFDLLAVLIISIRLVIQNARYILILVAYMELYEFLVDNFVISIPNYNFFYDFYSKLLQISNLTDYFYFIYVSFPTFILQGLYLFFHLLYTLLSNYLIYLIIVFWFFSFLYTMFFYERPENHFKFKRF